jgi:dihydrofolate reductase
MTETKYIAVAAVTADGKIARDKSHMSDWTSKEDKVVMRDILKKSDVVVVGNNTYKTAIKPLSKRNCIVFTRSVDEPVQENPLLLYVNPSSTDVSSLVSKKGYKTVCILGGAQTYSYMISNNLTDEIYLTVEPLLFGEGIDLFNKKTDSRLKLLDVRRLNDEGAVLLHYKTLR